MPRIKWTTLLLLIITLIAACTRTNDTTDPPVVVPDPPDGVLYINCVGDFAKINVKDSSVVWKAPTVNLFASFNHPMMFDSTTFYHGNYGALTAYSTITGIPRWSFSWLAFNNAMAYREAAIKDTLLFLTSPTSVWDHAYLYCLNKRTGTKYWQKKIDVGFVDIPFNTTPMVMNDNVIVITRDAANRKRLTAFRTTDATEAWASPINDSLSWHLRLEGGKIYSTSKKTIYCYSATNGALLWQYDLPVNNFDRTAVFFEQDKLALVKVNGNVYNIFTLNAASGNMNSHSTITVPTEVNPVNAPLGCAYSNNTLYVASHHNFDSVSLRSYDLSSLSQKWGKKLATYYYTYFTPLLTNKYLIFPTNTTYPNGKSRMNFFDLNGNAVKSVPFDANYTAGYTYMENGVIYRLTNEYIGR